MDRCFKLIKCISGNWNSLSTWIWKYNGGSLFLVTLRNPYNLSLMNVDNPIQLLFLCSWYTDGSHTFSATRVTQIYLGHVYNSWSEHVYKPVSNKLDFVWNRGNWQVLTCRPLLELWSKNSHVSINRLGNSSCGLRYLGSLREYFTSHSRTWGNEIVPYCPFFVVDDLPEVWLVSRSCQLHFLPRKNVVFIMANCHEATHRRFHLTWTNDLLFLRSIYWLTEIAGKALPKKYVMAQCLKSKRRNLIEHLFLLLFP